MTTTDAFSMARAALSEPPSGLAVITPSYGPDLALFQDLHASVLRCFPDDVVHVAVVPAKDRAAFAALSGPRCVVLTVPEVLPPNIMAVPGRNIWVNRRRPWPPLRGWIVQQLLKFAVVDRVAADALVLADSDVVFVRPVDMGTFTANGAVRFYRVPGSLDESLPRHMIWTREAGRMLDLPVGSPPYDDHIFSPITWDRRLVLATRRRIEEVTGRSWSTEVGRRLHVSECLLYGAFVNAAAGGQHPAETADMQCHTYWDEVPLDESELDGFLAGIKDTDIAIMLSAKSRTSTQGRHSALRSAGLL